MTERVTRTLATRARTPVTALPTRDQSRVTIPSSRVSRPAGMPNSTAATRWRKLAIPPTLVSSELFSEAAILVYNVLLSICQPSLQVCRYHHFMSLTGIQECLLLVLPLLVQVPINKACDAKAACCQGEVSQVWQTGGQSLCSCANPRSEWPGKRRLCRPYFAHLSWPPTYPAFNVLSLAVNFLAIIYGCIGRVFCSVCPIRLSQFPISIFLCPRARQLSGLGSFTSSLGSLCQTPFPIDTVAVRVVHEVNGWL